jgi:transketolase
MKLLNRLSLEQLEFIPKRINQDMLEICIPARAGHIAPSLSCTEILVALYYHEMNIAEDPHWEDRDRMIFSKAHGCYSLYAILADIGYIPQKQWHNFYRDSELSGCSEQNIDFGIEASCGSLGHGLPMAVGQAFAAKLQKKNINVYCIIGDGEMQEGTNWEALQFASKFKLDNLIIIIDANKLQAMDFVDKVLTDQDIISDLTMKMQAFGCHVETCNGHSLSALLDTFSSLKSLEHNNGPKALIADTIKGHGLNCMEGVAKFHFRLPKEEDLAQGGLYEK